MHYLEIEMGENVHRFETPDEAEKFLGSPRRQVDGTEFWLYLKNEDNEVENDECWMYFAPTFEDQTSGEFKISPEGSAGDYDRDSSWIDSDPEEGDILEYLCSFWGLS